MMAYVFSAAEQAQITKYYNRLLSAGADPFSADSLNDFKKDPFGDTAEHLGATINRLVGQVTIILIAIRIPNALTEVRVIRVE